DRLHLLEKVTLGSRGASPEEETLGEWLFQFLSKVDKGGKRLGVGALGVTATCGFVHEAGHVGAVRCYVQQLPPLSAAADFFQRRPRECLDAAIEQLPVDFLFNLLDPAVAALLDEKFEHFPGEGLALGSQSLSGGSEYSNRQCRAQLQRAGSVPRI